MVYRQNIAIIGLFTGFNLETARVLAELSKLRFLDSIQYLEYQVTYSIRQIIEDYGEEFFLKCEAKAYRELSEFDAAIIGASATALLNPENIRKLRKTSYIIMLTANRDLTRKRFLRDPDNYLKDNFTDQDGQIKEEIIDAVTPLCDIIIDTEKTTPIRAAYRARAEFLKLILKQQEEAK